MSFGWHRFDQKTNEIFFKISALASKKRSYQTLYYTKYVKWPLISIIKCLYFFWFNLFLEARAEILKKNWLVFWSKRWHQKDILKLCNWPLNVFNDKNLEAKHLVSNVLVTNVIGVKELESVRPPPWSYGPAMPVCVWVQMCCIHVIMCFFLN